jgi:hypothetical protein
MNRTHHHEERSMADAPSFAKLVPGFDFLQGLVKNAGAALPSIGQWVAPTLDPDELEKRINDLKTVQFWLEQNARMLGATIQALEVQKMTLSTLRTMNVQMADLRDSLTIRMPESAKAPAAKAEEEEVEAEEERAEEAEAEPEAAPAPAPAPARRKPAAKSRPAKVDKATDAAAKPRGPGAIDPLQWWGALTKQFTELASNAIKETTSDAARSLAGQAMKKSIEAAADKVPAKTRAGAKARKRAPARKRVSAKA